VDAIQEFDSSTASWHWPLILGLQLKAHFDHIFYSRWNLKCCSAKVIQEGQSDHFPVVAFFSD
jgi:endonuclease/exonuclease/phosphatase (EEP) superfamily protein YafD